MTCLHHNEKEETVWNFAVGSNMSSKIFNSRRHLHPLEVVSGVVQDHALAMVYRGLPFVEPVFAAIERSEGAECHGVLLKLTRKSYERLLRTEGGGGVAPGYVPIRVNVRASDGRMISAYALAADQGQVVLGQRPSQRYMRTILEGAREHGLSEEYQQFLASIPTDSTPKQLGIPLAIGLFLLSFPTNLLLLSTLAIFLVSSALPSRSSRKSPKKSHHGRPEGEGQGENGRENEKEKGRENEKENGKEKGKMELRYHEDGRLKEGEEARRSIHLFQWGIFFATEQLWLTHSLLTLSFLSKPSRTHQPFYPLQRGRKL